MVVKRARRRYDSRRVKMQVNHIFMSAQLALVSN